MNNIDATYEQACIKKSQGKWDTENLRYGQACILETKGKYYKELVNTITTFNENKNTHLYNANIQEEIIKVMMEDGEESITDYNNVTADAFSHGFSSQR